MSQHSPLTLSRLTDAVRGDAVAIRAVARLQPADGPGGKVFPPTYMKEGRATTKYAMERRWLDGTVVDVVLLDSVASQANRIEESLLEAWRRDGLDFPVVAVDFRDVEGLEDLDQITTLQAPHRIADAILRDSLDVEGTPFRQTAIGRACTDARPNHATALYLYCPTCLLFGVWDSTGPRGGLGAKFQRVLVSEIVGYDAVTGVKTASRLDPLAIEKKAGRVFVSAADQNDWTPFEAEARMDNKGKPAAFSRSGAGEKGTPAAVNHSNIPPSLDDESGGVTMSHARHTVVLSLAGLRRLRFPRRPDGSPVGDAEREQVEAALRTALAALGVAGVVYHQRSGYDLRSRSLLIPEQPLVLEVVGRDGSSLGSFSVSDPASLVRDAAAAATALGFPWSRAPLTLTPTPKLTHLVRESRRLAAAGVSDGDE